MPTLTITAVTHNSVSLSFAGEAADGTNEIQIGIFKDFEFCVCPVITGIARGSTPTIQKLNQATSYYIRSEEHTSELQSLMRISYAFFCLKQKNVIYHK